MPIRTAIWQVSAQPQPLAESSLGKENLLEAMIIAAPRILSDEWMLIGQQEETGFGGRIDLLAIAPDGSLVLIELKRNRTPREVVAQAIWRTFGQLNQGKSYPESVKPMNFALSPTVAKFGHPAEANPEQFHLLGSYQKDPTKWLTMGMVRQVLRPDVPDRSGARHVRRRGAGEVVS